MSEQLQINETLSFEDFKNQNWMTFWWATDLMRMLWYANMKSFQKVLDRTTKAFVSLWIPHYENMVHETREIDGKDIEDCKLTRFWCYLTAMNWDSKKEEVARAQAYFAENTRKFELYMKDNKDLDRILIREELTEWNKTLASTAHQAWVQNFPRFQNAWYLWMYNMESWKLENKRKVGKWKLMDFMWRTELAANLFRITQTEERIKSKWIKWQHQLEKTHYDVWKEVRNFVQENSWKAPENLPQVKKLPEVKKALKSWYKKMKKES